MLYSRPQACVLGTALAERSESPLSSSPARTTETPGARSSPCKQTRRSLLCRPAAQLTACPGTRARPQPRAQPFGPAPATRLTHSSRMKACSSSAASSTTQQPLKVDSRWMEKRPEHDIPPYFPIPPGQFPQPTPQLPSSVDHQTALLLLANQAVCMACLTLWRPPSCPLVPHVPGAQCNQAPRHASRRPLLQPTSMSQPEPLTGPNRCRSAAT